MSLWMPSGWHLLTSWPKNLKGASALLSAAKIQPQKREVKTLYLR